MIFSDGLARHDLLGWPGPLQPASSITSPCLISVIPQYSLLRPVGEGRSLQYLIIEWNDKTEGAGWEGHLEGGEEAGLGVRQLIDYIQ